MDLFEELVDPDYYDYVFEQQGRDGFKELFTMAFKAFPDWYEAIEDIIAEEDKVWVRVKATGTHSNEWDFFGVKLPPSNQRVTLIMVFIWRLLNGRLVEGWEVDADLDFLKKLGLVEFPENGKELEEIFR